MAADVVEVEWECPLLFLLLVVDRTKQQQPLLHFCGARLLWDVRVGALQQAAFRPQ